VVKRVVKLLKIFLYKGKIQNPLIKFNFPLKKNFMSPDYQRVTKALGTAAGSLSSYPSFGWGVTPQW